MSTKYLGRSVIELGRGRYDKFERRLRAKAHRRLKLDEDGEYVPPPVPPAHGDLRDHLAPLRRWLDSNVGRSWAKVFSEFCTKFDTKSLQGRHILTHLRQYVKGSGGREPVYRYSNGWDYVIDDRGILREGEKYVRPRWGELRFMTNEAEKWANDREVTFEDGAWFWVKLKRQTVFLYDSDGRLLTNGPLPRYERPVVKRTVAGRMSNEDVAYWNSLPQGVRNSLYVQLADGA